MFILFLGGFVKNEEIIYIKYYMKSDYIRKRYKCEISC